MELNNYADRKINFKVKKIKISWKLKKLFKFFKNGTNFLDVGCATGILSDVLPKNSNYYGIDYNEKFIAFCKNKNLRVKSCDLSKGKIPYSDEKFDIIYCSHVVEHLTTSEQIIIFREFSRILKKDGILFVVAPTSYHWYFWDDETHVRPCTHGQLINLSANFNIKFIESKYSLVRIFPNSFQRFLRLPPLRWFLWEVFFIGKKSK